MSSLDCRTLIALALLCGAVALPYGAPSAGAERDNYRRPSEIPYPEENPYSAAKAELGQKLFFDPILSSKGARSCASCHNPGLSWSDGLGRAIGEGEVPMALRSPTLLNLAWTPRLGWDGKFHDLEAVAFAPITSPKNMNLPEGELIDRLSAIPGYVRSFVAAFGEGPITRRRIEAALATYERSIVSAT